MFALDFVYAVNGSIMGDDLTSKNCYDLWEVLFKWGYVDYLVTTTEQTDVSPLYMKEVLNSICSRTLLYGKPFEYISNTSLSHSCEEYGVYAIPMSQSMVKRSILGLKDAGLIISFMDKNKQLRCIGLDFYNIVVKLYNCVKKSCREDFSRIGKAKTILKGLIRSRAFISMTKAMQSLKGILLPTAIRAARLEVKRMCPTLAEKLLFTETKDNARLQKRALKGEGKISQKMQSELTDTPPTTSFDAGDFLINWEKLIVDSGLYPEYLKGDEAKASKDLSLAKSFLREELGSEKTWEQLKDELRIIIDGWGRIPPKLRKLPATTKEGKPYNADFGATPEFKVFYYNRATIKQLCRKYAVLQPRVTGLNSIVPKQEATKVVPVDPNISVFDF